MTMAQGREWTKEERDTIIQSLKPFLEMGYSRNKACSFVGLTPSTLSNWVKADDALGILLTSFENVVNTVAMQNVVDAIKKEGELQDDIKKENSWKWLERRMKDDFSTKTEQDLTSGGNPLSISFDSSFKNNATTSTTEENSEQSSEIQGN